MSLRGIIMLFHDVCVIFPHVEALNKGPLFRRFYLSNDKLYKYIIFRLAERERL